MSPSLLQQIPNQVTAADSQPAVGSRRKRTRPHKPGTPSEQSPQRPRTHTAVPPPKESRDRPRQGREWREPWLFKGVRRIEGSHLFQLRIRVGPLKNDSVNFGTYLCEDEARRVARLVNKGKARGEYIWDTLVRLQAQGEMTARILPRWVYRRKDGLFGARLRTGPRKGEELKTPVASPILAHDLFRAQLGLRPLCGWKPRVSHQGC
jgi:hypothetical protein